MKYTTILSLLIFLLSVSAVSAQVRERTRTMSKGTESALVVQLPNVEEKLVEDVWQDYIKDAYRGKTKWDRREKEWVTEDVSITAIGGGNTVDLYAVIEQTGKDVELALWCDLGGAFLSSASHRDRYEEAERMLIDFSRAVAEAGVEAELEQQEDLLKQMENDLKKLQRDNERYHKEIEKAEEAIRQAREEIAKNEKDQEAALRQIEKQQEAVEEVKRKLKKF